MRSMVGGVPPSDATRTRNGSGRHDPFCPAPLHASRTPPTASNVAVLPPRVGQGNRVWGEARHLSPPGSGRIERAAVDPGEGA
jgi:hypothetical protein